MPNATTTKPKIIFEKGRPREVILRWQDYKNLLKRVEDEYDLEEIKKLKKGKEKFREIDDTFLQKYGL